MIDHVVMTPVFWERTKKEENAWTFYERGEPVKYMIGPPWSVPVYLNDELEVAWIAYDRFDNEVNRAVGP